MAELLKIADFIASECLLPIFFFSIGLDLVREFRDGDLRDLRRAALPALAAVGGVVVPALIYLAVAYGFGGDPSGWAIPTATDIAFSLAVLSLFGKHLNPGCKLFLTVLAVVDDVIGILIIAIVFSSDAPPLTVIAVAIGILVGIIFPPNLKWSSIITFVSDKIVVPIFAVISIIVSIFDIFTGFSNQAIALVTPIAIILALVIGKPVGIILFAWIGAHLTPLKLFHGLRVRDLIGTAALGGIGFTVSFLIASLSFADSLEVAIARLGVMVASVLAALLGIAILKLKTR
ncbi:MAG: Na+/H+ antiporter NhaA [Lactobacillales bacterium]|jgi:NhaA family Na+:H+ antiporter|nr:Na+/H+ antiporter NhaA [Lactobacillales bacterium]